MKPRWQIEKEKRITAKMTSVKKAIKEYKNKTGKNPITGKDNKHTRIKVKWTTKRLTG